MWNEWNCALVWHSLALPFFGTGMKTDLFQSCGHFWVLPICWHIECGTLTASSFRIWNISAGIPSPSLALLIVILPKAYFTLQDVWFYMRDHIIVASGSLRPFLYSSSVYFRHVSLIFSTYIRSLPFLSFIVPIFAWNVLLVSSIFFFLKRSLVFLFYCFPLFLCIFH